MLNRICGARAFGVCATALLPLLLAFSATGCNGGPTRPSADDRVRLYTGRWSGNINGFEIVLDMQATHDFVIGLGGTGTARNPATGEIHRLEIFGFGEYNAASSTEFSLNTPYEIGPPPRQEILVFPKHIGDFRGAVSGNGRTWPGHWTSTTRDNGLDIFGPGTHAVTLTKE